MNPDARELAETFDLEKLTPDFYANPYPTYRALREHAPVKRLPNGCWFLTRYDDLVAAYKTNKPFRRLQAILEKPHAESILGSGQEEHKGG